jgi:hypothetical protein
MGMHKPVYEERLVAYVDILGFSELVESLGEKPEFHSRVLYALTYINLKVG